MREERRMQLNIWRNATRLESKKSTIDQRKEHETKYHFPSSLYSHLPVSSLISVVFSSPVIKSDSYFKQLLMVLATKTSEIAVHF